MSENKVKQRLNLTTLAIFRENRAGRTSSLKWSLNNGYPRVTVFINGPDRSVSGRDNMIIVPFTYTGLNNLLSAMSNIISEDKGSSYKIECYNNVWDDVTNKRTDRVILQSSISVVKDSESGVIYLLIEAKDKPKMRFNLLADTVYFKTFKNGNEITKTEEGSKLFTRRYVKQLEFSFDDMMKKSQEVIDI